MNNNIEPIFIDFPLRGDWISPNTPGSKIPSHGIDQYGETYAYDFVKVNSKDDYKKFYDVSIISYLLKGVVLEKCYGWGSEIYAPLDGEIVEIYDGVVERNPVNIFKDMSYMQKVTTDFQNGKAKYYDVAGNYIIIKCSSALYMLFAHLQKGSITVDVGDKIKRGEIVGRVGHSGNSTAPHLHFQVMDRSDFLSAKGILCGFKSYRVKQKNEWVEVKNGIPKKEEVLSIR